MELLLAALGAGVIYLLATLSKTKHALAESKRLLEDALGQLAELRAYADHEAEIARKNAADLQKRIDSLSRFVAIEDAEAHARALVEQSRIEAEAIVSAASVVKNETQQFSKERRQLAESLLADANAQASKIILDARTAAECIAGDAYRALREVDALQETAKAMKNVIEGYGDRYLKPTYSLLDELAELYSFDEAGKQLKMARERTKIMVDGGRAGACEYVEAVRRSTAIHFVVDAFNGKVDTILARSKQINHGTLEQQIKDAFALVNSNGTAFRNARITDEFLNARLDELRWATAVMLLRDREREEQRTIRDRIREEERVRKEIDRAMKEAAKEEEMLDKAMARVRTQVAKANDEQRAVYEEQLLILEQRLMEAEAKSQRALSMAQQTRAGHVYVISNIGSFGENVLKVGMTRRLEPADRVRELSDASVPFSFDVHAMIWCEDAPALERSLHMEFVKKQLNKVNPRKEFFRIGVADVRAALERRGLEGSWTMAAAAAEYRESLAIEEKMSSNVAVEAEWIRQQAEYKMEEEVAAAEVSIAVAVANNQDLPTSEAVAE